MKKFEEKYVHCANDVRKISRVNTHFVLSAPSSSKGRFEVDLERLREKRFKSKYLEIKFEG
jgi:hypothetical protein